MNHRVVANIIFAIVITTPHVASSELAFDVGEVYLNHDNDPATTPRVRK